MAMAWRSVTGWASKSPIFAPTVSICAARNRTMYKLTRREILSSMEPLGDPFGGAAFGRYEDPITAISAGANLIGGVMQADAASSAADAQAGAANNATASQAAMFNTVNQQQAP